MPAAFPTPRRAPVPECTTTGPCYVLEARLLRRYRRVLQLLDQPGMNALVRAALGPAPPVKPNHAARQAEDRELLLDEKVPELVQLLRPHEQAELAPLLLCCHDVAGFARAVIARNGRGNALHLREDGPGLDDAGLFKAAGLGKLSTRDGAKGHAASLIKAGLLPKPPPAPRLVLTPWLPPVAARPVGLRSRQRVWRKRGPVSNPYQLSLWPLVGAAGAVA